MLRPKFGSFAFNNRYFQATKDETTTPEPYDPWADYDDYAYDPDEYANDYKDVEVLPDYGDDEDDAQRKEEEDDILSGLSPEIYCDLVTTLNAKCLEVSILEIWKFDEERIRALTQQDIINAINKVKKR